MATDKTKARERIRLGILFGGRSGEHEVSVSSAGSMIRALDMEEFEVTAIGITRSGRIATGEELRVMLPADLLGRVKLHETGPDGEGPLGGGLSADRGRGGRDPEIIFPLLHGPYGEDGTIQGLMEIVGLPYVGCGVLASAIGMDKDIMKRIFAQAALPIAPYRTVHRQELEAGLEAIRRELEAQFGYPVFSKPANLGSSVGVVKIHNAEEFDRAVLESARFDRKILIEKGIDARELECAVLGNDQPQASVVGEIIPACEFYDYDAKYVNAASRTMIPADIDEETAAKVREVSLRAFRAIDGSGLARVDFFLDRHTGDVWLNEINTMPGFTSISMYPKLWGASGVPFGDLIRRLVRLGQERFRERAAYAEAQIHQPGG